MTNFNDDFQFSEPKFYKASTEEDKKFGIDCWLCGLPFACRKRRKDYDDITIRYKRNSGAETEYIKILNGSFKAVIFIFEFPNKIILCSTTSIKNALENHKYEIIKNTDDETSLAVIALRDLKHIVWKR